MKGRNVQTSASPDLLRALEAIENFGADALGKVRTQADLAQTYLLRVQEVEDENARLQRVVDDLADGLRSASARLIEISRMAHDAGQQEIYNHAYYGGVLKTLERNGFLRACDDPAQVPSAMRAEVD